MFEDNASLVEPSEALQEIVDSTPPPLSPQQQRAIRDGLLFERKFFGVKHKFSLQKLRAYKRESLTYDEWFDRVKRDQDRLRWNPIQPKTVLSINLFEAVRDNLPRKLMNKLFIYCALGTAVDYFYGIDGFFTLRWNPTFAVTFDLSLNQNPEKVHKQKANVIITPPIVTSPTRLTFVGKIIAHQLEQALRFDLRQTIMEPLV